MPELSKKAIFHLQSSGSNKESLLHASANNSADEEVHKVSSYALTQYAPATSSIVPVLALSAQEPQREVLTYGLLNMQSDSKFILEDLSTVSYQVRASAVQDFILENISTYSKPTPAASFQWIHLTSQQRRRHHCSLISDIKQTGYHHFKTVKQVC